MSKFQNISNVLLQYPGEKELMYDAIQRLDNLQTELEQLQAQLDLAKPVQECRNCKPDMCNCDRAEPISATHTERTQLEGAIDLLASHMTEQGLIKKYDMSNLEAVSTAISVIVKLQAQLAAELMGWEVWVEQDTTGRRDKYYCSKEKDFIMWVKDWQPLTDANQRDMLVDKYKDKYDIEFGILNDIWSADVYDKDTASHVGSSKNADLGKACVDAIWDAVHGEKE